MKINRLVSLALVTLALGAFGCDLPSDQTGPADQTPNEAQALTRRAAPGGTVSAPPANETTATPQINNGGGSGSGGGPSTECTSCKISKITECANTCTPADVQRDGDCKAVIKQCIDDKCADQCKSLAGGFIGSVFAE